MIKIDKNIRSYMDLGDIRLLGSQPRQWQYEGNPPCFQLGLRISSPLLLKLITIWILEYIFHNCTSLYGKTKFELELQD